MASVRKAKYYILQRDFPCIARNNAKLLLSAQLLHSRKTNRGREKVGVRREKQTERPLPRNIIFNVVKHLVILEREKNVL